MALRNWYIRTYRLASSRRTIADVGDDRGPRPLDDLAAKRTGATTLGAEGSFRSVPRAFERLDEGLQHVVKLQFGSHVARDVDGLLEPGTDFSTDHLLLDLNAADPSGLTVDRIAADCEHVTQVARQHPEELRQLVDFFQSGTRRSTEDIAKTQAMLEEIGLTEEASLEAGGGLVWILVLVGAAVLVGGCATTSQEGSLPPR